MTIKLKRIQKENLEKIMYWRMDENVTKFMYSDPQLSMKDQLDWYMKIVNDKTCRYWIIEVDKCDVGLLSITNINRTHQRCDWAYYIADPSVRGKGIGTLLECNVYDYVFDTLKLNKLCCEVFCFNEKVIKLHEKFGSVIEGKRVQHIYKNGKYHDIVEMAILKSTWKQIKSNFSYDQIEFEGE